MIGIDLFAGCGGMSLGFNNNDIDIVAAFDHWMPAINTYKENFKHEMFNLDLSIPENYSIISKYNADIIIGGPPCQDFSSAGKRDESLGRADLTIHFSNIIALCKPAYFVMENVDLILKSYVLKKSKQILKNSGYGLSESVLNASYCGVPQNRKRYFLVGELGGNDSFLQYYLNKNKSKDPMSLFDYLGNKLGTEYYYRHPRSYSRRAIFSIHEPSPTIRGVNRPIPKTYKFHPGDASKDINQIRPLTTKERSLIQTFPEEFNFIGSNSEIEQQIGNAVPVKLAEYVSMCLHEYMTNKENKINTDGQIELNYS